MKALVLPIALASMSVAATAHAAEATSVTQYGVTWTFDRAYETGRFATGDHWVVGPVTIVSVDPAPTGTRHGSAVNPRGGSQAYDSRGGQYEGSAQADFPLQLAPDSSLVSSVSKGEGAEIKNAGNMISQAVLTVVDSPRSDGALRPAFAGTYKRHFQASQILWDLVPKLPRPSGAPNGASLIASADRPRADHLNSWTIQNSCAEENWNNGPGQHACYGREYGGFVSDAALYVMLDTAEREELALSLVQLGIDNYGILKAGGKWAPNGGHHNGRKWPIVFAARLLNDCDMLAVGKDYDDSHFGEDGQTYLSAGGEALFGWDCGGGHGTYLQNGCSGSGAKDCRDPAGAVDGCPDYRNCCTSSVWVGEMLAALMIGAKSVWNHDAFFDYVDRWMSGDVSGADGSSAFAESMWNLYRENLPRFVAPPACGTQPLPGSGGAPGNGGAPGSGGAPRGGAGGTVGAGGAAGAGATASGGAMAAGGASSASGASSANGGASSVPDGGAGGAGTASDDGGCGCRVAGARTAGAWALAVAVGGWMARRRRRTG